MDKQEILVQYFLNNNYNLKKKQLNASIKSTFCYYTRNLTSCKSCRYLLIHAFSSK